MLGRLGNRYRHMPLRGGGASRGSAPRGCQRRARRVTLRDEARRLVRQHVDGCARGKEETRVEFVVAIHVSLLSARECLRGRVLGPPDRGVLVGFCFVSFEYWTSCVECLISCRKPKLVFLLDQAVEATLGWRRAAAGLVGIAPA